MNIILIILVFFIISISLVFYYIKYNNLENKMNMELELIKKNYKMPKPQLEIPEAMPSRIFDINNQNIKDYDYRKLYDPYTDPNRRANQHELPFIELQKNIDLPTRGYPDNYILLVILIPDTEHNYEEDDYNRDCKNCKKKSKSKSKNGKNKNNYKYKIKNQNNDNDNIIYINNNINNSNNSKLKLFGRQIYPGSNQYEYYALDDNFGNYIKYEIPLRKNELYDNDIVYIRGFSNKFITSLYKQDMPRYFPHIF
jgi:hypothetical protein